MKPTSSSSLRGPGQRSISSFLLPKSSLKTKENSDASSSSKGLGGSRSRICSLSEFLDRKLPVNKAGKGKLSSLFANKNSNEEIRTTIDTSVFELFKNTQGEKVEEASSQSSTDDETAAELARWEGDVKKKGHVLVIGDDPKPRTHARVSHSRKRPRASYNHYKNGGGWWDSEREGIDADEVGSKEVWEGLGSTTLGGLAWN